MVGRDLLLCIVCAGAVGLQALLGDANIVMLLHRIRTLLIPIHRQMKLLLRSNPQHSQNGACQPLTVSSSHLQFLACRSSTVRNLTLHAERTAFQRTELGLLPLVIGHAPVIWPISDTCYRLLLLIHGAQCPTQGDEHGMLAYAIRGIPGVAVSNATASERRVVHIVSNAGHKT